MKNSDKKEVRLMKRLVHATVDSVFKNNKTIKICVLFQSTVLTVRLMMVGSIPSCSLKCGEVITEP